MLDAPTTNTVLVESAADPDNGSSWERLYTTYQNPILEHCERSGLTDTESADVVQEVLGRLVYRLKNSPFNWQSSTLRGWLSQTTNNLIFEVHRVNQRNTFSPGVLAIIQEWLAPALAPAVETKAREQLEGHLWSVCLARTRHGVRPQHWQIFECYAMQGHLVAEVAQRFNTTGFNVRLIRHRIVARIRKEWANLSALPIPDPEE